MSELLKHWADLQSGLLPAEDLHREVLERVKLVERGATKPSCKKLLESLRLFHETRAGVRAAARSMEPDLPPPEIVERLNALGVGTEPSEVLWKHCLRGQAVEPEPSEPRAPEAPPALDANAFAARLEAIAQERKQIGDAFVKLAGEKAERFYTGEADCEQGYFALRDWDRVSSRRAAVRHALKTLDPDHPALMPDHLKSEAEWQASRVRGLHAFWRSAWAKACVRQTPRRAAPVLPDEGLPPRRVSPFLPAPALRPWTRTLARGRLIDTEDEGFRPDPPKLSALAGRARATPRKKTRISWTVEWQGQCARGSFRTRKNEDGSYLRFCCPRGSWDRKAKLCRAAIQLEAKGKRVPVPLRPPGHLSAAAPGHLSAAEHPALRAPERTSR